MTDKEMLIFKGIVGLGVLMIFAIVGLIVFGFVGQSTTVSNASQVAVQPTEVVIPKISSLEEEALLLAFRQKIAPIEVGPAHRAVEQQLIQAFEGATRMRFETYESFLRPILTAYFRRWYEEVANEVFVEREMEVDSDLVAVMLSSADVEDKVHFMLLYEKVFLKNRGIVIED